VFRGAHRPHEHRLPRASVVVDRRLAAGVSRRYPHRRRGWHSAIKKPRKVSVLNSGSGAGSSFGKTSLSGGFGISPASSAAASGLQAELLPKVASLVGADEPQELIARAVLRVHPQSAPEVGS
jgi:hypothetical protein